MLKIDILTLFPEMFEGPFKYSIVKRAQEKGLVKINIINIRDFADNKYKTVDDRPYGGGAGMLMRVDIIDRALQNTKSETLNSKVILTDASGSLYTQKKAVEWSKLEHLIFIAGHYEGVDARVKEHLVDESVSIGPYVLSGGELPIAVMIDSVVRLIPGVLGNNESLTEESHNEEGTSEYPQYTRPPEYKGWQVPGVLLSSDPKKIKAFQKNGL
jgi:tRNA (guanine37-N1)-methyltransferase